MRLRPKLLSSFQLAKLTGVDVRSENKKKKLCVRCPIHGGYRLVEEPRLYSVTALDHSDGPEIY
jgi:hypothetical protein